MKLVSIVVSVWQLFLWQLFLWQSRLRANRNYKADIWLWMPYFRDLLLLSSHGWTGRANCTVVSQP